MEYKIGTAIPDKSVVCCCRSRFWVDTEQYLALNRQNRGQNCGNAHDLCEQRRLSL